MSCVLYAARFAASRSFVWLFGALVVLGITAFPAHANDPDEGPAQSWCIVRSGEQPDCGYDDLLVCSVKAFATGGYCGKAEPAVQAAVTAEPAPPPKRRKPPRQKPATADNDRLFNEFVRWKEAGGR